MNSRIGYATYNERKRYDLFIKADKDNETSFYNKNKSKHAFYVIEIPRGCGQPSTYVKLGRTENSLKKRLNDYYTAYGNSFFILYVKIFTQAQVGSYFSLNGKDPIKLVSNYESEVKKTLKLNNISPIRNEEYFANYKDVLKAINMTDERLKPNQNMVTRVNNRRNIRERRHASENDYWMGTKRKLKK